MKTNRFLCALIFSLSIACTAFDEPVEPVIEDVLTRSSINEAALRESAGVANINNPYSVENMQKAAIHISRLYGTQPRPIYATHEYVRFLPQDSTEVDILEDELMLELVNYPLDRLLSDQEVEFYSSDRINGYTWQYGVVPKNFNYPTNIRYEVLQNVYMESGDSQVHPYVSPTVVGGGSTGGTTGSGGTWYDEVLTQSMKNAGIPIIGGSSSTGGSWRPQAKVTYHEDAEKKNIPLPGVKVRVSTLMNVGTGYTDNNGIVDIAKGNAGVFKNPVRYQIKFENNKWKIKNSIKQIATIQGPKTTNSWVYHITPTNKELSAYAAIHRALYYFYFKQNVITKPTYAAKRLKIVTLWDQSDPDKAGLFTSSRKITIWGKYHTNNEYYNRYHITRTTFHELGHASHHMDKEKYKDASKIVKESYADAVAYYCMSQLYPDRQVLNKVKDKYSPKNPDYTMVGESLFNQGVTMSQLQAALLSATTWDEWRQAVKYACSIPYWIVDLIFDYKEYAMDFNIQSNTITHENGTFQAYVNQPTQFDIQSSLVNAGATV